MSVSAQIPASSAGAAADAKFERRLAKVEQAIDLHHTHLTDYLHSLSGNWHDAQDIAQDLWKHVLLHFPEDKIGRLGILRRKAYQIFIDHYRYRKRRGGPTLEPLPAMEAAAPPREAYSEAEEETLRQRFWSEFPGIALSDLQKECLWLHARYGHTFHEIAAGIGIPKSTAADWVAHARKLIQAELETNL